MTPSAPARGIDATGAEVQLPVPSEDLVVTDANGLDRKLYAGQPVPRDLLDAYNDKVGASDEADEPGDSAPDYSKQKNDDLEAEIQSRGLEVPEEGSGKDGKVVKADLVAVLEKHDAEADEGGE